MNLEAIFDQFPVLKADDLELKKVVDSDLDELYEIYSNEHVFKYCGIIPKTNKATIKSMITHFDRDYNKKSKIKWGIYSNSRLVGIIEAFDFNKKIGMVTVGYYLAEAQWRKGIATKALKSLVQFLFEKAEVNRIQAEVMPRNEISKKVLLKNGFIKEGTLREAALWSGKGIVDLEIYSMLKKEYLKLTTEAIEYVTN